MGTINSNLTILPIIVQFIINILTIERSMSGILVFVFLSLATVKINFCSGSCIERERKALIRFKHDLIDHANRLESWSIDEDCCGWHGVVCDNATGHVLELHLRNPQPLVDDYGSAAEFEAIERSKLRGKLNSSLLRLKYLSYLDLSNNAFEGIPKFLGSFESLRFLYLSNAGFGGLVPHQLGNLSNLQYLDLSADLEDNLYVANLQWLSGLSLLEHLDLSNVNLGKASDWLQVLNTLPSLKELFLSNCQLPLVPPPTNLNLSSLAFLDLSANSFQNPLVFSWIFHLNNLVSLDLSKNDFEGRILDGLQNLTSLKHLDLSYNSFHSSIPDCLYNLNSLQFLYLESNNLQGKISSAIGNMTSAISLDFSNNELEGKIPRSVGNLCNLKSILSSGVNLSQDLSVILEILSGCVSEHLELLDFSDCQLFGQLNNQLGNFKNLKELYLSSNSISSPIPLSIGELSSLKVLELDHNKLKGQLPESFGQLGNLEIFDVSNNLLAGVVSEIHFGNLTKLKTLNASGNQFQLKVSPKWIPPFRLQSLALRSLDVGSKFPLWLSSQIFLEFLDISNSMIADRTPSWFWNSFSQFIYVNLSHNQIQGQIPSIPRTASPNSVIDLSFNHFSGPLPQISSNVSLLDLSNNFLSGSLFGLLCYNETMAMEILNLGKNLLSGEIPDCWLNWQSLLILQLDNNRLSGSFPSSIGTLYSLLSLYLQKNQLSGEIPLSLKNCTDLVLLNVGDNELHGNIPKWIGNSLQKLRVLSLRLNKFSGNIPDELCASGSLQILDLANNDLLGSLPRCISNFSAMVKINASMGTNTSYVIDSGTFFASIMMKGQMLEYGRTLNLVRSIDCSNNNLSGEIPMEVTNLFELQSLNLSHNHLTGTIPDKIGEMRSLESIDFSVNKLSGSIPKSMSNLTFVNKVNLSYNNLTGEIPKSTQLLSFDSSSFVGNQLCGLPLPNECPENGKMHNVEDGGAENGDRFESDWFYLGMAVGFVVGFWSVFGPLVIDKQWRSMYTLSSIQKQLWKISNHL